MHKITSALAIALVALSTPALAGNTARNQAAPHHASPRAGNANPVFVRNGGRGAWWGVIGRSGPAIDARGNVVSTRVEASEGLALETREALASPSSERRYRGELCQVLPTHAAQRACLASK